MKLDKQIEASLHFDRNANDIPTDSTVSPTRSPGRHTTEAKLNSTPHQSDALSPRELK